jgi:acyl carrier protein
MTATERTQARAAILGLLDAIRRPDSPSTIGDDDGLVDSGLIDSLAVLEIVAFLETEFGLNFRDTGVDPTRLASVNSILDLIADARS